MSWINIREKLPAIKEDGRSDQVLLLSQSNKVVVSHIETVFRITFPGVQEWRIEDDNGNPIEEYTHWHLLPKLTKETDGL